MTFYPNMGVSDGEFDVDSYENMMEMLLKDLENPYLQIEDYSFSRNAEVHFVDNTLIMGKSKSVTVEIKYTIEE